MQRLAGNAAVGRFLADRPPARAQAPEPVVVSRCGLANPECGCNEQEQLSADLAPPPAVQRDGPLGGIPQLPADNPFAPSAADRLRFADRFFLDDSLPTVCPNCHRERPTAPMPPRYVDHDATEERLVAWGKESQAMLRVPGTIRPIQLNPSAPDALVDDYGTGLTKRITSSREFTGSSTARDAGVDTVRRRWPDIRPVVRDDLVQWYQTELMTAVGGTPKLAAPVLRPDLLRQVLATHYGERASLGRLGAEAIPGQTYGAFAIDDIGAGSVWFHLPGRPLWLYEISKMDFIRHDPLIAAVAEQVYDQTKWILQVTPMLLKAGAFAVGFSGSLALVILGIAMDELAEEMKAGAEGRPGRSAVEILGDAGMQLLVDRVFHHLLGGSGKAAAAVGRNAEKVERIAERAAPVVRRELANAEKPLVKSALEGGTARKVTDKALKSEGYLMEVAVESAGEAHVFRLTDKGLWCRFSTPVCGLDLGADLVRAAKEPTSYTATKLADTRDLMKTVVEESDFLRRVYERLRRTGRVELSLLSAEERALLDQLAPSGKAADLSLSELRDLPRTLGLKRDFAVAASDEVKLIEQLYREGRPIYEIMRLASPSYASRSVVLAESAGRDAVTGVLPRTGAGALHVDHVVPLNDIVQMPGFKELRPARQLEIVNDVKNLRAIDARANVSRGDRSWHEWANASLHYDAAGIARMRALEDELRGYLSLRIASLKAR